jgi:hypothetical protein
LNGLLIISPARSQLLKPVLLAMVKTMTLSEIQKEAAALPERQRVDLVRALLDTLPPAGVDVSDEEVKARDQEMESGEVEPLSHEEFVHRVQAERGK